MTGRGDDGQTVGASLQQEERHCDLIALVDVFQSFPARCPFPSFLGVCSTQCRYRMDHQQPTNPNSDQPKRQTISHTHTAPYTRIQSCWKRSNTTKSAFSSAPALPSSGRALKLGSSTSSDNTTSFCCHSSSPPAVCWWYKCANHHGRNLVCVCVDFCWGTPQLRQ